jgi:hypothetical protein
MVQLGVKRAKLNDEEDKDGEQMVQMPSRRRDVDMLPPPTQSFTESILSKDSEMGDAAENSIASGGFTDKSKKGRQ